jgi:hypothetical protein
LDADRRWEWREGWKRGRRLDGGRRRPRMGGEAVETATTGDGVRGWEARRWRPRRRATASADGRRGEVTGDALWKVEGASDVQDSRRVIQAARSVADGGGAAGCCGGGAWGEVRRWTTVGRLSVGFFSFRGNGGMAGLRRVKGTSRKLTDRGGEGRTHGRPGEKDVPSFSLRFSLFRSRDTLA